ncbi:MAG: ABC transporter substrate-binding protein, partial [Patescibacteria group bacterium]
MKFSKKLLALFVIALIVFSISGCRKRSGGSSGAKIELTYYKLFDDEDTVKSAISDYESANPGVNITYKKFTDVNEYEEMLLNELAEGEGPDIFEIQNTWVPRYMKKVVPFSSEVLTPEVFEQTFVSVAADDLIQVDTRDGEVKIYGMPLSVDSIALYYKKEYFDRYI